MRERERNGLGHLGNLENSETLTRLEVLLTLSLTLGLGSRVKVRNLPDTDAALTSTKTVGVIVVGGSMVSRAVIPDSCHLC